MVERLKAMAYAQEYLRINKRPEHTPIVRVLDGGEPNLFLQWFAQKPNAKVGLLVRTRSHF
jgi:hypothetical protein